MVQARAFALGSSDVGSAERRSFRRVFNDRVFDLSRMPGNQLAELQFKPPGPQGLEDGVGGSEVGAGRFDQATQRFQHRELLFQRVANLRVHRQVAEIGRPRQACLVPGTVQRRGKPVAGFRDGNRTASIRAGQA